MVVIMKRLSKIWNNAPISCIKIRFSIQRTSFQIKTSKMDMSHLLVKETSTGRMMTMRATIVARPIWAMLVSALSTYMNLASTQPSVWSWQVITKRLCPSSITSSTRLQRSTLTSSGSSEVSLMKSWVTASSQRKISKELISMTVRIQPSSWKRMRTYNYQCSHSSRDSATSSNSFLFTSRDSKVLEALPSIWSLRLVFHS